MLVNGEAHAALPDLESALDMIDVLERRNATNVVSAQNNTDDSDAMLMRMQVVGENLAKV
ncbi:MAG: hypothetical protein WAX14_03205 [Rhodococcus sp. (in: high G+C Gram-positive bacteria)]|uniref:hypothetical protein n=1 Tax=Rhodococcus sp. TaxID=1831 RepID=UPI003BB62D75